MNRKSIIVGILVLVLAVAGGIWLWNWALGPTQQASGSIQATPLVLEPTQADPLVTDDLASEPTQPYPAAEQDNQGDVTAPVSGIITYQISQPDSEVRFTIFEELRGQPVDVVGVSDQVAGEIAVDPGDLSQTQVGVIQVNARTLVTDENQRNQAIRNRILNTDSYEFITFTPQEIIGLTGSANPGQEFSFQIAGDLTIRDVTQPIVFDVTAQMVADAQIQGSASATIQRGDFNLAIPNVPFVANVGEEVTLEIDFVANAAS
jgi:polyisoprenoid-binding protein YceI